MAQLYDVTADVEITRYINFDDKQDVNQITNKALDGTPYLTVIGDPFVTYPLTGHVDQAGKDALKSAHAGCNLLRVTVRRGTYYGRIIDQDFNKLEARGWYSANITLAAEVGL